MWEDFHWPNIRMRTKDTGGQIGDDMYFPPGKGRTWNIKNILCM